jgi:preprotein translocase subunit SecA
MRIFGSDRVADIMDRYGGEEQKPLTHPLVTRAIANAQKRVEENHFETRKRLLEYDDVMNKQREEIYKMRNEILKSERLKEHAVQFFEETIEDMLLKHTDPKVNPEQWGWDSIKGEFNLVFLTDAAIPKEKIPKMKQEELLDDLLEKAKEKLSWREQELGEEAFSELLKFVQMATIDRNWRSHLYELDDLRQGISLRAYAQKDPLVEYKRESRKTYEDMRVEIAKNAAGLIFRAQPGPRQRGPQQTREFKPTAAQPSAAAGPTAEARAAPAQGRPVVAGKKVGRNDPCPCGSGKKYKKCCGRNA